MAEVTAVGSHPPLRHAEALRPDAATRTRDFDPPVGHERPVCLPSGDATVTPARIARSVIRRTPMDHTYKITEIVGSSSDGVDAAIRSGIKRASKTLRNIDWFEVTDMRGAMNDGEIAWFQVTMKVGFRLEDGED
jgi:dodecin